MKSVPVTEFMTRDPVSVRPEWRLPRLVDFLRQHGLRGAVVTDDDGRVVGVATETDLFLKDKGIPFSLERVPTLLGHMVDLHHMEQFAPCRDVRVEEVMTRDVTMVDEQATLEQVALLMLRSKVTLVPVVSDGRLVGEVRRIHILRLIYATAESSPSGTPAG